MKSEINFERGEGRQSDGLPSHFGFPPRRTSWISASADNLDFGLLSKGRKSQSSRPVVRRHFPPRAREAGMNLVEILIALAIFSIGVVQVMTLFPMAVMSGAETVRGTYAALTGNSALAELQCQARVPIFFGGVINESVSAGDDVTTAILDAAGQVRAYSTSTEPIPPWQQNQFKYCFITAVNRYQNVARPGVTGGVNCVETALVTGNGGATADTWQRHFTFDTPSGSNLTSLQKGDVFRFTRYALPVATDSDRTCTVVTPDSTFNLVNPIMDLAAQASGWNPVNTTEPAKGWIQDFTHSLMTSRYFVVMTSGRANRKVYMVWPLAWPNSVDNTKLVVRCNNANFTNDGVSAGDTFVIIGSPEFAAWQPCPHFGPGSNANFDLLNHPADMKLMQTTQPSYYRNDSLTYTGTMTGAQNNTMNVAKFGSPWAPNELLGSYVRVVSSSNAAVVNKTAEIIANTPYSLTVDPAGWIRPNAGDVFAITPGRSVYTYATIVSNTWDRNHPAEDLVRVDVLVFRNYNNQLPVDLNQRAVGHYVYYLARK